MTLPAIDRNGASTSAAAEGQAALASGDTVRAREKYDEAGAQLERRMAAAWKQGDKHFYRFLAASQYYHGGNYGKALALCRRIEERLLPAEVRHLFPPFARDVQERAEADYRKQVRQRLKGLRSANDHGRVLELLREHPYVLARGEMAFHRALACEGQGNYRAAAAFYADAVHWNTPDPNVIFQAASLPLAFLMQGRVADAWTFVQEQLETIPHAVTFACASLICNFRATTATQEVQRQLSDMQLHYFDNAWQAYLLLPPDQAGDPNIRWLMGAVLEKAALICWGRLGDLQRARSICDLAIAFDPLTPDPRTVRGIVTYPSEQAVADFRQAVALGDTSYVPYYSLAHHAMTNGDFRAALPLCEQALQAAEKPPPRIESSLHAWLAICRDFLGADPEQVDALFRKACAIDPQNEAVAQHYRLFREHKGRPEADNALAWNFGQTPLDDVLLCGRENRLRAAFTNMERRILAEVPAMA